MVANCPVSLAEWHDILERLFRQECGDDIHAAATVSTDPSISIVVRRSTQGITVRHPPSLYFFPLFFWVVFSANICSNASAR